MSMNTFFKNMTQSVDDIKTSLSQTETNISAFQDTTNESLASLSTDISTLESDTTNKLSTKQNTLNVVSNINVNTIKVTDMKLGATWLKNDLLVINDNINKKFDETEGKAYIHGQISSSKTESNTYADNKILSSVLEAKIESDKYTDDEVITLKGNTKNYIASELITTRMQVSLEIREKIDEEILTAKTESDAYTDEKVATNKSECVAYTDATFSPMASYITSPSIDTTGSLLNDFSIVNKGYIDTRIATSKAESQAYTDSKIVGSGSSAINIHTLDSSNFNLFESSCPANSTTLIAQLFFTPKNGNSRHNMFFNVPYFFPSGAAVGTDKMSSYAKISQRIDDSPYSLFEMKYQSYSATQFFVNGSGGGTRSGVIFPLQFSVKPNILRASTIIIQVYVKNDCDDPIQFERNEGCWFSSTELQA